MNILNIAIIISLVSWPIGPFGGAVGGTPLPACSLHFLNLNKAGPYRARRGAGTSIFGTCFSKNNFISPTYSTVPASGASRRDPPRHGDFGAQILVKKGLM